MGVRFRHLPPIFPLRLTVGPKTLDLVIVVRVHEGKPYTPLAQWIEHLTTNQEVIRSSRIGRANNGF